VEYKYKGVVVTKPINDALSEYAAKMGVGYGECFNECLTDYLGVLSNVKSRYANLELKKIYNKFEMDFQQYFDYIKKERKAVTDDIFVTRLLTDEDMYKSNPPSCPRKIPDFIHDDIKSTLEKFPYLYNRDKKAKMIEIVDRSIIFKVILNDSLLNNEAYKEWRLQRVLQPEKQAKVGWSYLFENLNW